jgi:hypothetical protein
VSSAIQPAPALYRPAEVAALLRCSEWWVKEQARRRRIPYIRAGGRYLFTAEHIAEIVRLCEVRPIDDPSIVVTTTIPRSRTPEVEEDRAAVRLTARVPRRARRSEAA